MAGSGDEFLQDQLQQLNLDFDAADTDKSGSLSLYEVHDILFASGFTGSRGACNKIFFKLDENKDMKVSREEFNKGIGGLPRASRREMALLRSFQAIDKDKSGSLSQEEIMDAINYVDKATFYKVFEHCWKDADGKVHYDEFLRLFNFNESESVLKTIFGKLDKDGSGKLSVEEMTEAVNSEGELARLRPQIQKLLAEQAKDITGKEIDFNKFIAAWLQQREEVQKTSAADSPYI